MLFRSFNRSQIETIKSYVTRQVDIYRPPFGRHDIEVPRQCVFAGSTNSDAYLVDTTGNRRFWPVKVGKIDIVNNQVFTDRAVIRAMRNLRPVGIPYSIYLENLFARTYDSSKLDEDRDRIRNFYQIKGYFQARTTDAQVQLRDTIPVGPHKIGRAHV